MELLKHIHGRADMLRATLQPKAPVLLSDAVDRWVLASLLQKAIRRGQSHVALAAALRLYEIDPSRLWRRLLTVALEDVGVGSLDCALDLAAVSSLPPARKLLGGSRACLEILIPLACVANKDRTADHLASLARWQPSQASASSAAKPSRPLELIGPWESRISATFALAGAWERGRLSLEEVLDYASRQGAPLALLEACGCYARRCGDPLFLYALTAWSIWADRVPEPLALARQGLAGQDLGGIPDFGLDPLRTRLGRRAVELWLRSYLEKPSFKAGQIVAGLWNAEAALCNQILFWEPGGALQKAAYEADLLNQGLDPACHAALLTWISQEAPVLLSARQMVWQSHLRAGYSEGEGRQDNWENDDDGGRQVAANIFPPSPPTFDEHNNAQP